MHGTMNIKFGVNNLAFINNFSDFQFVVCYLFVLFRCLNGRVVEFFDFSEETITSFFGVTECTGNTLFRNFGHSQLHGVQNETKNRSHLLFFFNLYTPN